MSASANVTAAPAARTGMPPWNALVVGITALLAVAIGGVLASFLMTNRAALGTFALAGSVPADAPLVYELRLDLPGGQAEALEQLLGHFPAAASDAIGDGNLERWIDDQLEAAGLDYRYATDVKPWFDGRVTFAVLELSTLTSETGMDPDLGGMTPMAPGFAVVIGSRDPEAARIFVDRVRADAEEKGLVFSSETYAGVEVWSQSEPDPFSGMAMSFALDRDGLILAGDPADVREILDVRAGRAPSLVTSDDYRRLTDALAPDAAASFFVNTDALIGSVVDAWRSMPELEPFVPVYERLVAASGAAAATLHIEPNGLRADVVAAIPDELPVAPNAERGLDAQAPGDAIFFADAGRIGELLAWYITAAKEAMPDASASPEFNRQTIADVEAALGSDLEAFVSWIDDAALVAGWDGSQPYAGAILTTDEPDAARQRIGQLRALAELGAAQAGMTFSEEEVAGVEVVTVRFPMDDAAGLPLEPVVQYAIDERRVVVGVGDQFVRRVLELDTGASLAASDRYRAARDAAGPASNQGVAWLDLVALRAAIEPNLPPDVRAMYDQFVAAWVDPLDYLVGVTSQQGDVSVAVSHFRVR